MTHQAKRPYAGSQPCITSYFPLTPSSSNGQYNISNSQAASTANDSSFPNLPANVQSNLISVGMRVRKSVPEGYNTGTYSAFNLFNENTAAPQAVAAPQKTPLKTRPRAGARELTPFCGILKVGGMAQQQWGIWNPSGGNQAHDGSIYVEKDGMEEDDEVPFLSSQASTISTASVTTPVRENKRRFFEDGEDEEDEKKSFTNRGLGERVLAVPRRKKSVGKVASRAGQENVTVLGQDVDFEDAEFLDYGLIGEVEMSG